MIEANTLTGDLGTNELIGSLDYRIVDNTKIEDVQVNGTSVVENKVANIDLTGKQDTLTAGTNITIENNVISSTASGGEDNDILVLKLDDDSDGARAKAGKMITANYGKGLLGAVSNKINPGLLYNALASQTTSYTFDYTNAVIYTGGDGRNKAFWFEAQGSWSNNVFTCTRIIYYTTGKSGVDYRTLTTNNISEYTPTNNYHPATKKYVDDAISNAITDALGGNY